MTRELASHRQDWAPGLGPNSRSEPVVEGPCESRLQARESQQPKCRQASKPPSRAPGNAGTVQAIPLPAGFPPDAWHPGPSRRSLCANTHHRQHSPCLAPFGPMGEIATCVAAGAGATGQDPLHAGNPQLVRQRRGQVDMRPLSPAIHESLGEVGCHFVPDLETAGTDARTDGRFNFSWRGTVLFLHAAHGIGKHPRYGSAPAGMHRRNRAPNRVDQENRHAIRGSDARQDPWSVCQHGIGFRTVFAPGAIGPHVAPGVDLLERGGGGAAASERSRDLDVRGPLEKITGLPSREAMDKPGIALPASGSEHAALISSEHTSAINPAARPDCPWSSDRFPPARTRPVSASRERRPSHPCGWDSSTGPDRSRSRHAAVRSREWP